jgi:hypothetical protein
MKTVMFWVKISELVENNRSFKIIPKNNNGVIMWCLLRNNSPIMYQEISADIKPFFNVSCLIEGINENTTVIEEIQIKAFATGISQA